MSNIPIGQKVYFDDDLVRVYTSNGTLVYNGRLDECPYKEDFDRYGQWNEEGNYYDLSYGYKLIGLV